MSFIIRNMQLKELSQVLEWAEKEGWNPGLYDAESFYAADPHGFFIGLLDNEPIAAASVVCYDDHFAFGGLYIVKNEFRAKGYGTLILERCLEYCGSRILGCDGVLAQVVSYKKIGFKEAHLNTRYQVICPEISNKINSSIITISNIPFTKLLEYDSELFPANRSSFLKSWIRQPESYGFGFVEQNKLLGYALARRCKSGFKIGPLFANTPTIAKDLLTQIISLIPGEELSLDVPEPNKEALKLASLFDMKSGFQVMRMYRNGSPKFDTSRVYGITTYELG